MISGKKFYDTNTDGTQQAGEPDIMGWRIEKAPPAPPEVSYTLANGTYSFTEPANSGDFTISEVPPPLGWYPTGIWVATTPTSHVVTVETSNVTVPAFGNACLGPMTGGHTLGFWSNRNGEALFGTDDLAQMVALNLKDAIGNDFNPSNYTAFRSWLLSANAVNMAYMLSAQLAAMKLNVFNGLVNGDTMVYVGVDFPGANPAGFISINGLISEANTSLGLYGYTPDGHAQRATQERLKNALDDGNNNRLRVVQTTPCPFTTPY